MGNQAVSAVPREQAAKGFILQLFLIPKKGGGKRPVINLKGLNIYVEKEHFKMENIHIYETADIHRRHTALTAERETMAREHTAALVSLLENLGLPKSLDPHTTDTLAGSHDQLHNHGDQNAWREDQTHSP